MLQKLNAPQQTNETMATKTLSTVQAAHGWIGELPPHQLSVYLYRENGGIVQSGDGPFIINVVEHGGMVYLKDNDNRLRHPVTCEEVRGEDDQPLAWDEATQKIIACDPDMFYSKQSSPPPEPQQVRQTRYSFDGGKTWVVDSEVGSQPAQLNRSRCSCGGHCDENGCVY